MNKKTLIILTSLVVLLAILASYPLWRGKIFSSTNSQNTQLSFSFDTARLSPSTIDKIILSTKDKKIILKQTANGWKLITTSTAEFDAKQEKIAGLFKEINNLKLKQIAGKNPDNYSSFETDEKNGTYVGFFHGENQQAELIIGKRGANYNTFYIKEKTQPLVFLAKGDLPSFTRLNTKEWQAEKTTTSTVKNDGVKN